MCVRVCVRERVSERSISIPRDRRKHARTRTHAHTHRAGPEWGVEHGAGGGRGGRRYACHPARRHTQDTPHDPGLPDHPRPRLTGQSRPGHASSTTTLTDHPRPSLTDHSRPSLTGQSRCGHASTTATRLHTCLVSRSPPKPVVPLRARAGESLRAVCADHPRRQTRSGHAAWPVCWTRRQSGPPFMRATLGGQN